MSKKFDVVIYMLHGWALHGQQTKMWAEFIKALKEKGIEGKLLKIPGLSASLEEVWGVNDYVQWLLKQLPHQPVILLGHSFGGQIAIRLANLHADRVQKLILIDSAGLRDWSLLAKTKRNGLGYLAKLGHRITSSDLVRRGFYKVIGVGDYYHASPLLKKTMSKVVADEVWSDLPKVKQPTLIIWGEVDKTTPLKLGQKMHQLIPSNQWSVVGEAGHSPHLTHPQVVADRVAKFIFAK
ncbi:alpha/beta hydrolase [Patescibacteria group bacterium]|nr:alpha/beta hydrolase [Patescibacteria group bacterium]